MDEVDYGGRLGADAVSQPLTVFYDAEVLEVVRNSPTEPHLAVRPLAGSTSDRRAVGPQLCAWRPESLYDPHLGDRRAAGH